MRLKFSQFLLVLAPIKRKGQGFEIQICDNKCKVIFSEHDGEITKDGKTIDRGVRKNDLYVMKIGNKPHDKLCLATMYENSTLWHRRLG